MSSDGWDPEREGRACPVYLWGSAGFSPGYPSEFDGMEPYFSDYCAEKPVLDF